MIRIFAILGSLRKASSNTALLRAAANVAPVGVQITVYDGLMMAPLSKDASFTCSLLQGRCS